MTPREMIIAHARSVFASSRRRSGDEPPEVLLPYPDDYTWPHETVMSNFDHSIDSEVAERMKVEKIICQYSGWNFCGWCWWTGEQFACNVWVYHQHKATILADTLQEIMDQVCDRFGSD